MSLKPKLEAIIYAAETPITLDQIVQLVRDSLLADGASDDADVRSRVRAALDELFADYGVPDRGIEIRQVAGGYRMSTKPEQHDVVRAFAKSLKPPIRLSLPALETLAVIAYKPTKEFLLRFGLKDVNELPSMEEFEKLVAESFQSDLVPVEETAQEPEGARAADAAQEAVPPGQDHEVATEPSNYP